jgi:hypothetical protein
MTVAARGHGAAKMVNARIAAPQGESLANNLVLAALTLARTIGPEEGARLNLGYRDPTTIPPADWQGRVDEGCLYVPGAGRILRKVRSAGSN